MTRTKPVLDTDLCGRLPEEIQTIDAQTNALIEQLVIAHQQRPHLFDELINQTQLFCVASSNFTGPIS